MGRVGERESREPSGERTLAVWCPDWPVVAQRTAQARGWAAPGSTRVPPHGPVAVLASGRVLAASWEARQEGVARGQRRREAEARCGGLVVVAADPALEARAFEEVARAIEEVAPRLALERPGVCSLPTRGPSRYFGGDVALARLILDRTQTAGAIGVGGDARVGIADSAFAARLAARRAASGEAVVLEPGTTPAFLAPWPVGVLDPWLTERGGAGSSGSSGAREPSGARSRRRGAHEQPGRGELVGLLVRLGIRTLGDLVALPAAAVAVRFGPAGLLARRLAAGADDQPLRLTDPPLDLVEVEEFDPPAELVESVAFAARGMAARFVERLAAQGLMARQVRVEAETDLGQQFQRLWRHDGPLAPAALAERVRWQLDGWITGRAVSLEHARSAGTVGLADRLDVTEFRGGLVRLRLVPDEVVPLEGRQLGFWGGDQRAADQAARALSRVQGMLGHDAVVTAVPRGGRMPSEQVSWVPWGESRHLDGRSGSSDGRSGSSGGRAPTPAPFPGAVPAPHPSLVFDPPVPARLLDRQGRPVTVDARGEPRARPASMSSEVLPGGGGPVEGWAGPWVHDLRWWDRAQRRRGSLWQVAVAGTVCLVITEQEEARIEAIYD